MLSASVRQGLGLRPGKRGERWDFDFVGVNARLPRPYEIHGCSLYSSGTSSNKSDTETSRAFASRSRVVVFTPLKGSLHILFIVKKDTSEALDKLDMLNPLDSAISFTLRRIILLPFGSILC